MDIVMFLLGASALVAGISKLAGAKTSWHRPAPETGWQFGEPQWLRRASGVFLILYSVVSFIGLGAGWFR